jgi:DNA-binding response OmpR family regulator
MARILIVEDEAAACRLAGAILQSAGHVVRATKAAADALAIATDFRPELLLVDWLLGDTTGLEVAEAMRAHLPALRVLFMTGLPRETITEQARTVTAAPILEKPIGVEDLTGAVDRILRSGSATGA